MSMETSSSIQSRALGWMQCGFSVFCRWSIAWNFPCDSLSYTIEKTIAPWLKYSAKCKSLCIFFCEKLFTMQLSKKLNNVIFILPKICMKTRELLKRMTYQKDIQRYIIIVQRALAKRMSDWVTFPQRKVSHNIIYLIPGSLTKKATYWNSPLEQKATRRKVKKLF